MGPRNLLILFFSTVAVSLVILIIFFSLFFKNVDLNFNTRLPESAPEVGGGFHASSTMNPESKADGLMRSSVNVPPDVKEVEPASSGKPNGKRETELPDGDLPPMSDDAALQNDAPLPEPVAEPVETLPGDRPPITHPERKPAPAPTPKAPRPRPEPEPIAPPAPAPSPEPDTSGPPVPGQ